MFTAAAQVAAVERRVTAYSEAGQGTDSSQPSFRVSEPCIPVRSGRPSLVQLAETGPASGSEPGAAHRFRLACAALRRDDPPAGRPRSQQHVRRPVGVLIDSTL